MKPKPLLHSVLEYVLKHGEVSVAQVTAGVGHTISAPQAIRSGRTDVKKIDRKYKKRSVTQLVDLGRRRLIGNALIELRRRGKLRRVRKAVYAPLLPQLYQPGDSL